MELNQFSTVDIVLDKANDNFIQKQSISAGDRDGRSLSVQITDAGTVGEVPGLTLNLLWRNHASGLTDLSAFYVVDKATNTFKIDYPQNMLTPGKVTANIVILHSGKTTHTREFEIIVAKLAGQTKGVLQTSEYTALVAALAKTSGFEGNIRNLDLKKTDKTYVDAMLSSIASGGPKELFYSITALKTKYPGGAQGTYLVFDTLHTDGAHSYIWKDGLWVDLGTYKADGIADLSVERKKIKDNAVNHLKTNYITTGKNKFLNHEIRAGGYVNYVTGQWHDNPDYSMSGKVVCLPGQTWSAYPASWIIYYSDGQHAGGFKNDSGLAKVTFTIPAGVNNFEMGFGGFTGREQIEKTSELSTYEEGYIEIKDIAVKKEQLKNFILDSEKEITDKSIEAKKVTFVKTGKNLFNPKKAIAGHYINPANGKLMINPDYSYSDYIDISEGTNFTMSPTRFYATYDADFNFVRGGGSGAVAGTIIIEKIANEKYVRTSQFTNLNNQLQVEIGGMATNYEEYYEYFEGVKIKSEDIFEGNDDNLSKIPNKIYATKNEAETYLFENIFVDKNHDYEYSLHSKMALENNGFSIDVSTKANLKEKFVAFDSEGKYVINKDINVIISDKRTTPLKVLLIGDSTVRSNGTGEITKYLKQYFGNLIELIGTMGTDGNFYEGRGGWTAERYLNSQSDDAYTNAFYNPITKKFDVAYYLQQNDYPVPDVIIFQLGINDMFRFSNDADAIAETTSFFGYLDEMTKNINQYNPAIKVAYNLPLGPTLDVSLFDIVYKKSQLQQRYQRNNAILVSEMIKKYSGIVDLIPIHLTINRKIDFADGVHLQQEKYIKPAKIIRNYLNSLE